MPDSTTAGIITASASLVIAVGGAFTAITGAIRSRRVERKVDGVHVIVNQQRTDASNYQRALINALQSAGVDVPADQSIEPLKGET